MKRILSFAAGILIFAVGISSTKAQESQFAIETIPVESIGFNMALSPDHQTLAIYSSNILLGTNEIIAEELPIDLIDINTKETIGSLSGHTDWVTDVSFSEDGQQLVSFHRNGDLLVWDVASLSLIKTIHTYTFGGGWVQFLADGKTVVYRAGEYITAFLDIETEAITRLFGPSIDTYQEFSETYTQFPGRGDIALAATAASLDGKWLATSSMNDEVTLIDVASREEWTLHEPSEKFGRLSIRFLFFSPDGTQLVYFDQDMQQTHWWDVLEQKEIRVADFGGTAFALAPDLTTIAWADRETSVVYITDATAADAPIEVMVLPEGLQVAPTLTSLAFTSDGTKLIIGGLHARDEANMIYVIDLSSQ